MVDTKVTESSEQTPKSFRKSWGKSRTVRLVNLYGSLFMRPLNHRMGSLDRWLDAKSPNWIKTWDKKRYTRTAVDRCLYLCRWFAAALVLAAVFLPQFFPQAQVLRNVIAPCLLLAALVIFPVTYAVKCDFSTAEENRLADARQRERRRRYGRLSRATHILYHILAFLTGGAFLAGVSEAIKGETSWRSIVLAFCMAVPLIVAITFSSRLMKREVTDLEYVKGTTTCREIVIYWLVATALLFQSVSEGEKDSPVAPALVAAITFVALARICSTGYKEFREAISSGLEPTKPDADAATVRAGAVE